MPQITYSSRATADLVRLRQFLQEKNPQAAKEAAKTIKANINKPAEFPHMGRPAADVLDYIPDWFAPQLRELLIPFGSSGYEASYIDDDNRILVTKIRHMRESD